jgi:exodeoxyribonuclease VII large subunit
MSHKLSRYMQQLDFLARRLLSPAQQLTHKQESLAQFGTRLQNSMQQLLGKQQEKLLRLSLNLQHLNPNAVLNRGYALVQTKTGAIVQASSQLQMGDWVDIRFAEGSAEAEIKKTK